MPNSIEYVSSRCSTPARNWEADSSLCLHLWEVPEERSWKPRIMQRSSIYKAAALSRHIVGLPLDPEEVGGGRYSEETWKRAISFLFSLESALPMQFSANLVPPKILPSVSGSIDLYWKLDTFELLINVAPLPKQDVTYYGDNTVGNMPIESSCPATGPDKKLLAWLSLML